MNNFTLEVEKFQLEAKILNVRGAGLNAGRYLNSQLTKNS